MKSIVHKSDTRGHANYGWLDSHHTFSFAGYHDKDRMRFGTLRVLNDDIIQGGTGFETHPHENMEIISIPLYGSLEHKDSNGNKHVIGVNDVQVMSAGTGITHSEFNHSNTEEANFLQIWIIPDKRGHQPRYDQKDFDPENRKDQLQLLIGTYCGEECLTINQKAWISRGCLKAGVEIDYHIHRPGNCVYCFIISGFAEIADQYLSSRDGIGISEADNFNIIAKEELDILIIEIPLYNE